MKKVVFIAGLLLCALISVAQVQVIHLPSTPYSFTLADWQRLQLVYANEEPVEVFISGSLSQGLSSAVLASFKSSPVVLQPGMNVFSESTLPLADLKLHGAAETAGFKAGNSLAPGSYVTCISVHTREGTTLVNSCQEVGIEPVSVPVLVYPSNGSVITELQPLFSWTPAIVAEGSDQVTYEMALFEVRKGQQVLEAAARNRPMFSDQVQARPQLQYPSGAKQLVSNQHYVWRVKAMYKGHVLGSSEFFSFRIGAKPQLSEVSDTVVVRMDPHRVGAMVHCNEVVHITFKHYVPNEQMQVVVKSGTGERYELQADDFRVEGPHGSMYIDLSNLAFLEEGSYYRLECIRQNHQILVANLAYKCR